MLPDYQHLVQSTIQYLHTQPQHADFYQSGVKPHKELNLPVLIFPSPHPRFS